MIIYAKQEINDFLNNYALYIVLGFVGLIAITVIVMLLIGHKKKHKNNPEFIKAVEENFYKFVGGEENVIEARLNGSRFVLVLKDASKLNKDEIKTLGVSNIISLKEKITLVLNDDGKIYFEKFKS